ncbi:MAG: hypothetical protein ACP5UM_11135 [Anaerolineae bacterium]
MNRRRSVRRTTRETQVEVDLDLDGSGQCQAQTGVGMLDHLLAALARHARFDLRVQAQGGPGLTGQVTLLEQVAEDGFGYGGEQGFGEHGVLLNLSAQTVTLPWSGSLG